MHHFSLKKKCYRPTCLFLSSSALKNNACLLRHYLSYQEAHEKLSFEKFLSFSLEEAMENYRVKSVFSLDFYKNFSSEHRSSSGWDNQHQESWISFLKHHPLSSFSYEGQRKIFLLGMVKANAYGHGLRSCSHITENFLDGFGVASLDEALGLRGHHISKPIVLMEGFFSKEEQSLALKNAMSTVIHQKQQLQWLEEFLEKEKKSSQSFLHPFWPRNLSLSSREHFTEPQETPMMPPFWLKINTGMNRLGFSPHEFLLCRGTNDTMELTPLAQHLIQCLRPDTKIFPLGIMMHFACADDISSKNHEQLQGIKDVLQSLQPLFHLLKHSFPQCRFPLSFCNGAGLLHFPFLHTLDLPVVFFARTGLLLYGLSPFSSSVADLPSSITWHMEKPQISEPLNPQVSSSNSYPPLCPEALFVLRRLQPVMNVVSRILSLHDCPQGSSIGYGHHSLCEKDKKIAVVPIGYGDGYPLLMKNGAPVLVRTKDGPRLCPLFGRISMDMLTLDVSHCSAFIGDEVLLWGKDLPVKNLESFCSLHSWAILTGVQNRLHSQWIQ